MKQAGNILLCALILFQSFGGLLVMQWKQYVLHQQIKENFYANLSKTISINISYQQYINNLKDESEIEINHHLYDIKSKSINGNQIILQVVNDKQEEELIAFCIKNTNKENNKKNTNQISKIISLVYTIPSIANLTFDKVLNYNFLNQYLIFKSRILNNYSTILIPPPKILFS